MMTKIPTNVPITEPYPPVAATPPTNTPPIASISSPAPVPGCTVGVTAAYAIAARPVNRPQTTYTIT